MQIKRFTSGFSLAIALMTSSAFAVTNFTETFNSGASNWLNAASSAATWNSSGGVADSGYISYTVASFSSGMGGAQLMFRGNNSADASGDAFVGNWISDGVISLSLSVRHNYTSDLNFYARLAASGGAGASLANTVQFAIAPNTWTTITIPIVNSNPPFQSYGSSNFTTIFSGINDLQFGIFAPADPEFSNFTMGIDNVTSTVPEPSTYALLAIAALAVLWTRRQKLAVR